MLLKQLIANKLFDQTFQSHLKYIYKSFTVINLETIVLTKLLKIDAENKFKHIDHKRRDIND